MKAADNIFSSSCRTSIELVRFTNCVRRSVRFLGFLKENKLFKLLKFASEADEQMLALVFEDGPTIALDLEGCAKLFAAVVPTCVHNILTKMQRGEEINEFDLLVKDELYWLRHYAIPDRFVDGARLGEQRDAPPEAPIRCQDLKEKTVGTLEFIRTRFDQQEEFGLQVRFANVKNVVYDVNFISLLLPEFALLLAKFVIRGASPDDYSSRLLINSIESNLALLQQVPTIVPHVIVSLKRSIAPIQLKRSLGRKRVTSCVANAVPTFEKPSSEELCVIYEDEVRGKKFTQNHFYYLVRALSTRLSESHERLWPGHHGILLSD